MTLDKTFNGGSSSLKDLIHREDYDGIVDFIQEYGEKKLDSSYTPLAYAAICNKCAAIDALLDAGVALEATDEKRRTALMHAVFSGKQEAVDKLIARKANIEARDRNGCTPLIMAADWVPHNIAESLLDAGAQIDAENDAGATALMRAAKNNKFAFAEYLIARGADLYALDKNDQTAFDHATGETKQMLRSAMRKIPPKPGLLRRDVKFVPPGMP